MYAHRGLRQRTHFRTAVELARQTVHECVGEDVPPDMLLRLLPWILKLQEHRERLKLHAEQQEDVYGVYTTT